MDAQLVLVGTWLFFYPGGGAQPVLTQKQQRAEVETFAARRSAEVKELLTAAKDNVGVPGRRGVAAVAVRKLGRMRAAEAADFLVEHLSFRGLADEPGPGPLPVLEESLPCVYALAEIGLPGFPRLLREVEGTDAEVTHHLAAVVLRRSMGEPHALLFLRHQHDAQQDEAKKKRLKSTMELLGTVKDVP